MSVSKKDVEYVAELARLEFKEEEKDDFVNDLKQNIKLYGKIR